MISKDAMVEVEVFSLCGYVVAFCSCFPIYSVVRFIGMPYMPYKAYYGLLRTKVLSCNLITLATGCTSLL
jgi:hypothetical protein